jgi:isoleucyl-tRNA synthetase
VRDVVFGTTLTLDTEITQDLREEGEVREKIRLIQDMRKEAGLTPSDRISIMYPVLSSEESVLIKKYESQILTATGAVSMEQGNSWSIRKV